MRKLLIALITFASTLNLSASHIFGGEIWYEYIGDSTGTPYNYMIYLRLYSDQPYLSNTQNLTISSSCFGSQSLPVIFGTPQGYIMDSTGGYYVPAMRSCNDDSVMIFSYDLYVHHYRAGVTLAGKCTDYSFKYSACCRQQNLDNIVNPSSQYTVLEAILNNTIGPNTSPKFLSAPITKFCSLNSYNVSHAAYERDADSIYYQLISPNNSSGGVSYSPGYSSLQPLQTLNGVNLNHRYGTLSFTPSQEQVTVLNIMAQEFRFDTVFNIWLLIGTSLRDIVYFTGNCVTLTDWGFQKDSLRMDTSINVKCGDQSIIISTKSPFDPTTLASDGSDFFLQDSQGTPVPITAASPIFDPASKIPIKVALDLYLPIQVGGKYKLSSRLGSDGNTLYNICGFEMIKHDTVNFMVTNCTTTSEQENRMSEKMHLYPSPASDYINVDLPESYIGTNSYITILNIQGQVVLKHPLGEKHQRLSIEHLESGLYMVHVQLDNQKNMTFKFVKN